MPGVFEAFGGASTVKLTLAQRAFIELCKAHELPEPLPEYHFASPRRWRFDYAWPFVLTKWGHRYIALECQGGLFVQGRHVRGAALLKEHEKLNAAACAGVV